VYKAFTSSVDPDYDPISHVEFYVNRDDNNISYQTIQSGTVCSLGPRHDTTFSLTTSDGSDIPSIPYPAIDKIKKKAVNVDLIVMKVSLMR